MVKKVFYLIILLLLSSTVKAQNVQKGFKFYHEHNYYKAEKFYKKAINKREDLPIAFYGMSLVYGDSLFEKNDPNKAYFYIKQALKYYQRYSLSMRRKWKRVYNIDYQTFVGYHDNLVNAQLQNVLASGDIIKINEFIRLYAQSPQSDIARLYIDSIYFEETKKQNTIEAYEKFINEHRQSRFTQKAQKLLKKLLNEEFHKAYSSLELSTIERFEREYGDYNYNQDSVFFYKDLAIRARQLMLFAPYKPEFLNKYIRFIYDAAPFEPAYLTLLKLIEPLLNIHDFDSAIDTLTKYKFSFSDNNRIDTLIALLKRPDKKLENRPIPGYVNTSEGYELMPVLTADGKTMFFCGERRDDNLGNEDIYITYFSNGKWQKPSLVEDLNTIFGNEAPLSVSADGNTLIYFSNGNVYISEKTKLGWSFPKEIKEINSDFWDADAFITADGNAILFVSDRPNPSGDYHPFNNYFHGGFIGNTDIWVVERKGDAWSEPINLGQVINTPYSERTPFLHSDMHTLYFASDGHASFGSMDLFVSYRLSDTSWTQWSEPVNLGKWFNSPKKEYGYAVSTDGKIAYYALFDSVQSDIYMVSLPKKAKPKLVITVFGYVYDLDSNFLSGEIIWEDLQTGEELGRLHSDPKTGYYVIPLPEGKNYGFYIQSKGYYPASNNLDLRDYQGKEQIRYDFILTPLQKMLTQRVSVRLNNIFFDFDSDRLRKESYPELRRLVKFIKENPQLQFEISGHTDSLGNEQYNKQLSLRRAKAVRDYLIEQGCKAAQLIVKGYGASVPIATNETEKGRQINRRVEIKILGKLDKK